jgi:hypothetical protein
MADLSNTLADLAERVKEANRASAAAQRQSIEKAFEAGFLLCVAKEQCEHGDWLSFLGRAVIHERQARRLMQVASSGLQIGHVSEIGGIRANLEYIAKLQLPEPGNIIFIGIESGPISTEHPGPCAWIEPAQDHPGYFHIEAINSLGECRRTTKPASGKTVRCSDGFFNGVWSSLEMMLDGPHAEREFTAMPAEFLIDQDDCPFLADMEEPGDAGVADPVNDYLNAEYRKIMGAN